MKNILSKTVTLLLFACFILACLISCGQSGVNSKDGATPMIGFNENWWIDGIDTGISAKGADGKDGENGTSIVNAYINEEIHLIIVLSNGSEIDAGYVGVELTPPKKTYTVTFVDFDGTVLKTEGNIGAGGSATPPDTPVREGYAFVGWDKEFSNVTENLTVTAVYSSDFTPAIVISNASAAAGDTNVTVTVSLKNNPGIASLNLNLFYESGLVLESIVYNSSIGGMSQQPQTKDSPVILNWINGSSNSEGDFVFATLSFRVEEGASSGEYEIYVTYDPDNVYDITETNIEFETVSGTITIS